MVAKEYLGRSRLFRRLKRGRHREPVKLYAARLVKDGLADQGIWRSLNLVGDLLSWIAIGRSKLIDLDERMVERYLLYRAGKHCIQRTDRAALKRLLSALREVGAIAPAGQLPITAQDRILEQFGDYLRRERGLVPDSVICRQPHIRRFLREVCPSGANDLDKISGAAVTRYIERHARDGSPASAKKNVLLAWCRCCCVSA